MLLAILSNSSTITDIWVPTTEELKKKIGSAIETYLRQNSSVLVQYWGAKEIGKTYVLTTTCQPFGHSGNNEELQTYRKACLDHKLYVYKDSEKKVAFGLSGHVFLNCVPEQTQNVHGYHGENGPPCEDAIFTKRWGSFAVPVIEANKCVGVLEFVMDTPKDSYDIDIRVVYEALEQSLILCDHPSRTIINGRVRLRKTKSFSITRYGCLVPYFGLSSARAAEYLGLKPGAFRDLCRNVGIPVWPWIRNTIAPGTQTNQIVYEASNADLISIMVDKGFSWEQIISKLSAQENEINQIAIETSGDIQAWMELDHDVSELRTHLGKQVNNIAPVMDNLDSMDIDQFVADLISPPDVEAIHSWNEYQGYSDPVMEDLDF